MHALVTGITGFVGGHLAEHLLAEGLRVTGCSRRGQWPPAIEQLRHRVRLLECDLADERAADRLLTNGPYDVFFHLAGLANPRDCLADLERARRENVAATRNLYEAIRRSGQRPRVLFVSSSYVYGQPRPEELPVSTACPIRAEHPYAASKWAAEQSSIEYATEHGLDIVRVRPFNHTGPRQPAGYIVSDWARQIALVEAGKSPPVLSVGNLDTRRDYTDVRDVVRAYRLLVEKAATGSVYNLGSGSSHSGREILQMLCRLSRTPIHTETDAALLRAGEAPEIVADASPLRELTGWRPQIDLETTLRDTLEWWRMLNASGRGTAGLNPAACDS
jgi:GDP-4-dehydro-6-deoxy-D-mannose reductase